MAKHPIRRWFQFGVLDLLILTTVVAVVVLLGRPGPAKISKAQPWIVGGWGQEHEFYLLLFPDGWFNRQRWVSGGLGVEAIQLEWGRWTLAPLSPARDAFVLHCGELRWIIRSEWGSGVIQLLKEDRSVMAEIEQVQWFEGPMGLVQPQGTWRIVYTPAPGKEKIAASLEYRDGEPTDFHDASGARNFLWLNEMRKARELPELTPRDFAGESAAEGQSHD